MLNYVDPKNISQEDIEEAKKHGQVTCGYKDLSYYTKRYWVFGAIYATLKTIFWNEKENKWIREYERTH